MGYTCLSHGRLYPSSDTLSSHPSSPAPHCPVGPLRVHAETSACLRQERGTSLWVAGELLPPSEFTWPRDEGEQIPKACSNGGHRGGGVGHTQIPMGNDWVFMLCCPSSHSWGSLSLCTPC